jgi:hypothetical protein
MSNRDGDAFPSPPPPPCEDIARAPYSFFAVRCPSIGPDGGSVAMDSVRNTTLLQVRVYRIQYTH